MILWVAENWVNLWVVVAVVLRDLMGGVAVGGGSVAACVTVWVMMLDTRVML